MGLTIKFNSNLEGSFDRMVKNSKYIDRRAIVDKAVTVGSGTRIWAFSRVVEGAVIGDDCNICDHTFIEGKVTIGNRVTVKCGVYLWDGLVVEDDVFIGPNATFTNDLRPRSRRQISSYLITRLHQGCSVGAGAVVLPGLTIGRWSMVAAGAVVTRDVHDHALVVGNPAHFRAWVCRCGDKLNFGNSPHAYCSCNVAYTRLSATHIEEDTLHES